MTAPGGRGVIADTLAQRGCAVHRADVYRRDRVRPRADRLAQVATLPAHSALLVSSGEAFDALWAELGDGERMLLRGRPAVASSPRLAAMLAGHGFEAIVTADHPVFGKLRMQNAFPKLSATPGRVRWPGPALGEHTDAILAEFGLTGLAPQKDKHDPEA